VLTGRRDVKLLALARLSHYLKIPIPELIERIARSQKIDIAQRELRLERDRRKLEEMKAKVNAKTSKIACKGARDSHPILRSRGSDKR
jgi:hypothetical protein